MEGDKEKIMALDKETRRAIVRYICDTYIDGNIRRMKEDIDYAKLGGWDKRNDKEAVAEVEGKIFGIQYGGINTLNGISSQLVRELLSDA